MGKARMTDDVFKWAAQYAGLGWHVVPCYGAEGKTCSCFKGDQCATPGKHPVGKGWDKSASVDEEVLAEWFDGDENRNVGVLLGPKSGIVDIEFDCEEGRKTAEAFGLDTAYTPTYTSKRSTHRLFRFDGRLPDTAVVKIDGLEIRIGGGGNASQSVMPPSAHASGVSYSWVEGMSPADCEVAEIPRDLLVRITNTESESGVITSERKTPATTIVHTKIHDGDGRHEALVKYAALKCIKMLDHECAFEQQEVLATLHAINERQVVPPKSNDEVDAIFHSALVWAKTKARDHRGADVSQIKDAVEKHANGEDSKDEFRVYSASGLEYHDGEWWPGEWKLTVVHSDPVQLTLRVPFYRKCEGGQKKLYAEVALCAESYRSSGKVAEAILNATHNVVVDSVPEQWAVIWNGACAAKSKTKRAVRGLKAKLMETADEEEATAENCHYAQVAGWLLDALTMTPKPDDDDEQDTEPDPTGYPTWVRAKDGAWELWFAWSRVWEAIHRGKRQLEDGDKLRCKKMIERAAGQTILVGRAKGDGGRVRRFIRFTENHMAALERVASADFGKDGFLNSLNNSREEK